MRTSSFPGVSPQSMYSALPGLLDGNPFSDSGQLRVPDGLNSILEVLKETLKLLAAFQVHPDISLQLCAYLFFFINASLFNALMERGEALERSGWTVCKDGRHEDDRLHSFPSLTASVLQRFPPYVFVLFLRVSPGVLPVVPRCSDPGQPGPPDGLDSEHWSGRSGHRVLPEAVCCCQSSGHAQRNPAAGQRTSVPPSVCVSVNVFIVSMSSVCLCEVLTADITPSDCSPAPPRPYLQLLVNEALKADGLWTLVTLCLQ